MVPIDASVGDPSGMEFGNCLPQLTEHLRSGQAVTDRLTSRSFDDDDPFSLGGQKYRGER